MVDGSDAYSSPGSLANVANDVEQIELNVIMYLGAGTRLQLKNESPSPMNLYNNSVVYGRITNPILWVIKIDNF